MMDGYGPRGRRRRDLYERARKLTMPERHMWQKIMDRQTREKGMLGCELTGREGAAEAVNDDFELNAVIYRTKEVYIRYIKREWGT